MANELLNPNGSTVNVGSWAITGGDATQHEAVDEGIASADTTTYISPNAEADQITFDLDASAITDGDTVTQVDIRLYARTTGGGNDGFDVELLIGGSSQGTVDTGNLGGSFATVGPLNTAGWNADWTASQLAGAQVRITATQAGKAEAVGHDLSVVEVDITYTASAPDEEIAATRAQGQHQPRSDAWPRYTWAYSTNPRPVEITLDKWWRPTSEPVRQTPRSLAALLSGAVFVETSIPPSEAITLDKWWQPASQPTPPKPALHASLQQALVVDALAITQPEVTLLSKWWRPASEPVPPKPSLHPSLQQAFVVDANAITQPETPKLDRWWRQASEPVRVRQPINVGPSFTIDPLAITQPETTLLSKWWRPASEPVRETPRSAAALAASGGTFLETSIPDAETITVDKWFQPASEPVRERPQLATALQQPTTVDADALTRPEATLLSKWWQPASEPIRVKTPINVGPAFTTDPLSLTVTTEVVTLDKWFSPASEPVRQPARLRAALQQASAFHPHPIPPPLDTWFRPASIPVLLPKQLPAALQQAIVFNPLPIPDAVPEEEAPDTHDGGPDERAHREKRRPDKPETRRAQVARELREAYEAVVNPTVELPAVYEDAIAEAVAPFAPASAPALPAPSVVDWQALVDEGRDVVREARRALDLARARVAAQQAQAARMADDEEAAIALLLL